jgi:hypothetical protein
MVHEDGSADVAALPEPEAAARAEAKDEDGAADSAPEPVSVDAPTTVAMSTPPGPTCVWISLIRASTGPTDVGPVTARPPGWR